MEQYSNNSQNEFLWTLLANPANDAHLYAYNLQRLVNDFPQSGVLQALLAHASEEKNLKQASAYFNPRSLFKLINAPSTFVGVPDERIFIQADISSNGSYQQSGSHFSDATVEAPPEELSETHLNEDHSYEKSSSIDSDPWPMSHFANQEPVVEHEEHTHLSEPITEAEHFTEAVAPSVEDHHTETEEGSHLADAELHVPGHTLEHEPANEPVEHTHLNEPLAEAEHTIEPPVPSVDDHHTENHEGHTDLMVNEEIPHQEETFHVSHQPAEEVIPSLEERIEALAAKYSDDPFEHPLPEEKEEHIEHPVAEHELPNPQQVVGETSGEKHEHIEPAVAAFEAPAVHNDVKEVEERKDELIETVIPEEHIEEPVAEIKDETETDEPVAIISEAEQFDQHTGLETVISPEVSLHEERDDDDDIDETYDEIVGIENIHYSDRSTFDASGDKFFSFDREFGEHADPNKDEASSTISASANGQAEGEQNDVSKYHDEKLPYSFLWWLDKTRKEHEAVYQPYVKPPAPAQPVKKTKKITDELQQQYFENIFHITSVEELDKSTPPPKAPYDYKRKEHVIIERFIKEEPQIRPQSSDKLDNENKAKKSSEDRDELVTETLAAIYTDQMLYHKAISSYKKLMLKFPEKSRYFADKIEQLEKKTN